MKIDRNEAVRIILEAHPNFVSDWEYHLIFWDGDEPGITNDFSAYARYVRDLAKAGNEEELEISSQLIERFIVEGDKSVEYGASLGFLEDVTNMLSHGGSKHTIAFTTHLKPKSREFCRELDKFWGTLTPGVL